ncbi:LPXTG cell wall anchor domain-containing protein [Staphylococcus delphini]|nr:LPXTG cell wall anchor domain-containing protein [Staphylococcus delphini]
MATGTSMTADQKPANAAAQPSNKDKVDMLPDTGQTSSQAGLFGAVAAMLTGMGLLKKSKKDKDDETSSDQ